MSQAAYADVQTDDMRFDCVRCLTRQRATEFVRFIYRGRAYEVPLCDQHTMSIQRDFGVWVRVARELTLDRPDDLSGRNARQEPPAPAARPGESTEPKDRRMKVVFPVVKGEVINRDEDDYPARYREPMPSASQLAELEGLADELRLDDPSLPLDGYYFTTHARERMVLRSIPEGAVWRTLRSSSKTVQETRTEQGHPAQKHSGPEAQVVIMRDPTNEAWLILTVGYPAGSPFQTNSD